MQSDLIGLLVKFCMATLLHNEVPNVYGEQRYARSNLHTFQLAYLHVHYFTLSGASLRVS